MYKLLIALTILSSSCATPTQLINRALRKDPEVLKKRMSAEIVYVKDTVTVYLDGEIVEVPVSVPVETTVIKWIKERTNKEERIDGRMYKAELQRFKLTNDSLELNNKKLKHEARLLRQEANSKNKESFMNLIIFIKDSWLFIVLVIFVLYFTPNLLKWIRNVSGQQKSKPWL